MKPYVKRAILTIGLLATALPVYADRCGLRDRIDRLEDRIERGIRRGQLTPREVRRIERKRDNVRQLYRDLREDGMSEHDCVILSRKVGELHEMVSRLKHNDYRDDSSYDRYRDGDYGRGRRY